MDNPFYYNTPVETTEFVGRWPLVEEIVADLIRPRGDSWAIIGGRRFGKSSLLRAIEARLVLQLGRPSPRSVIPFPVDLKRSDTESEQQVYITILREIHRIIRRRFGDAFDLPDSELNRLVTSVAEEVSFYRFETALDDLLNRSRGTAVCLVLLLDELDAMVNYSWAETLFNQLRALVYDGPLAALLRIVITGSERIIQVRQNGSPLLNAVKCAHLEVLDEDAVRQLIARGGHPPEDTVTAIMTQSGGHPFIAQYLLHHIWDAERGLDQATPEQVSQAVRRLREERALDLRGWWDAIGPDGQAAYRALIEQPDWADERALTRQLAGRGLALDQALAALCYHGLAMRDASRRRYRLAGTLFRDWVLDSAKVTKGDGGPATPARPVINTGKAWAVLVGINQYDDAHLSDLQVCVEDVTAIYHQLAPGYRVIRLLTDATPDMLPTRANILGELASLAQSVEEGDLLLFYFSGHGTAERGESYLLTRDTRLSALKYTALAISEVRQLMLDSPARAKVIVVDACHSGAMIGKAEPTMTPEFIQRVFQEATGMAVLASCTAGQQSWEWPSQKRSVFTYYLLEALAGRADWDGKGFVTVSDVSRYVTDAVKRWAAEHGVPQTPTLQYTVAGDIILARHG